MFDLENIPSYTKFDELITEGGWMPFIFVQPDASLYLPHYLGHKEISGAVKTKGSFYINSPYTGKFADFIIKDVIVRTRGVGGRLRRRTINIARH